MYIYLYIYTYVHARYLQVRFLKWPVVYHHIFLGTSSDPDRGTPVQDASRIKSGLLCRKILLMSGMYLTNKKAAAF